MKKITKNILKVVISLILLMPILGASGIFPEPTADLYNTPQAFEFIVALMDAFYINVVMAIVSFVALILFWTKRESAAAILILPITLNIILFHLFLDGGIFTLGALMADILFLINLYFIWINRGKYLFLLKRD